MDRLIAKKNRLLVKDDVGMAKPCVLKLPPQGFVYGKPDTKQEEGVAVITGSWNYPKQSRGISSEVDFRKLNKHAVFRANGGNRVSFKNKY